jgi:hypothetical protein
VVVRGGGAAVVGSRRVTRVFGGTCVARASSPDGKRTSLRLPCFWLRESCLVLPSFGSFTGGQIVQPLPGHRVFTVLRDKVVELPETLWKG